MQDAAGDSETAPCDPVEGFTPPAQNGLPDDEASEDAAPAVHQGEGWEGDDLVDGDPRDPEDVDMRSAGPTSKLRWYSGACSDQLGRCQGGPQKTGGQVDDICWHGK